MNQQPIRRRRLLLLSGFVVVVLLVGISSAAAVEVGQVAPDFSLDATTGDKISLSQFRGKQADHLHSQAHQLGRKVAETLCASLRISALDKKVLALNVAEVAQLLPEGVESWIWLTA